MRSFGRVQVGVLGVHEYRYPITAVSGARENVWWDPIRDGGHLILDFQNAYAGADVSLAAAYAPEVGDVLYITTRSSTPTQVDTGDVRLFGFSGVVRTFDGSDSTIMLVYSDRLSTGVWRVEAVFPAGKTLDVQRSTDVVTYSVPILDASIFPSTGTVRQTMGMAVSGKYGTELIASFTVNEGSVSRTWRGQLGASTLDRHAATPPPGPPFIRSAFGNGQNSFVLLGDYGGGSPGGYIGTKSVNGADWTVMPVGSPFSLITCPPVLRGSRILVGTDAGVYYSDNFGSGWTLISNLTPITAVALTDGYQFFTRTTRVYRSTTGSPSSASSIDFGVDVVALAAFEEPTASGVVLARGANEGCRFSGDDGSSYPSGAVGSSFPDQLFFSRRGYWGGLDLSSDGSVVLRNSPGYFGMDFIGGVRIATGQPRTVGNGYAAGTLDGFRVSASYLDLEDDSDTMLHLSIPESRTHDLSKLDTKSSIGATFRYLSTR